MNNNQLKKLNNDLGVDLGEYSGYRFVRFRMNERNSVILIDPERITFLDRPSWTGWEYNDNEKSTKHIIQDGAVAWHQEVRESKKYGTFKGFGKKVQANMKVVAV